MSGVRQNAGRTAAERLRRMRWTLTLLYTGVSALSLVALLVIAAFIDARSGARDLDSQVTGRAEALSRAVWMDEGVLHLEPLSEDVLATASDVTAVVQRPENGTVQSRWLRPERDSLLPPANRLDELWDSTVEQQKPVLTTIGLSDGRTLRWASAPVWNNDEIGALVLVALDLAPQRRSHTDLLLWLGAGCTVLVLASAGAGHLLSGRSMRSSMRTLDQQEQFLAEAAHELRTPLATLRLTMESNANSSAPEVRPETRPEGMAEVMPGAVRQIDHLDRLITGLLSRARIDTGTRTVELTPLRLDLLVEQVLDDLPEPDPPVSVHTEATVVLGDPDLLAQAVRNMIENGLRHGSWPDQASRVEVHVAAGQISVRDHGPGIAAEEEERVFGSGVTNGRGGIGVGLAIVRWVAELHGGQARAVSAPGGGALIELILPPFIVR